MKKIALVSFFKSNNIGDLTLSKALVESFETLNVVKIDFPSILMIVNTCADIQVTEVSNTSYKKKNHIELFLAGLKGWLFQRFVSNIREKIKERINGCDAIIMGGGNMLMDTGVFPCYTYLFYSYAKAAEELHIPFYVVSIGVGPFKTKKECDYAKRALRTSTYVSVRDEQSVQICADMGVETFLSGDPAFSLQLSNNNDDTKRDHIACCFCDYGCVSDAMSKADYLSSLNKTLDVLKKLDKKIILFSTEKQDYDILRQLVQSNKDVHVEHIKNLNDLMELYSNSDLIISMRMHAIILGMLSKRLVYGLSWQKKVTSLFKMAGLEKSYEEIVSLKDQPIQFKSLVYLLDKKEEIVNAQNLFVNTRFDIYKKDIDKVKKALQKQ